MNSYLDGILGGHDFGSMIEFSMSLVSFPYDITDSHENHVEWESQIELIYRCEKAGVGGSTENSTNEESDGKCLDTLCVLGPCWLWALS